MHTVVVRPSVLLLLVCFALDACTPGEKDLPPRDAAAWTSAGERTAPGLTGLLLDGYDPMGDWRLARTAESDWSLLAVTPEARGTWRLTLRRSAWSESSTQVLSDFHHGVLVLSQPLELAPGEEVRAFFHVLVGGRELFVPDTRLAQLAALADGPSTESAAGFRRAPSAERGLPVPGAVRSNDLGG